MHGHRTSRLVFISAAEASADMHGAALIRATHKLAPDVRFVGVAGPRMVEAGCDAIYDMTCHAAMLLGAVANLGRACRMMALADECLRRYAFSAAVVIDSPTLHLPLAGRINALSVPVLYYVAPQMWAWGAHRIYKLRHRVEQAAVILPFEEEYFRDQGVNATYVGHPLADRLGTCCADAEQVRAIRRRGEPVLALLPGSRAHVVEAVLPGQLEVARAVCGEFPSAYIGVSAASESLAARITQAVRRSGVSAQIVRGDYSCLVEAADLVLVASGTAALEVAFFAKPMIVMYQASRAFYHLLGRWMIRTPFLSLPNILAQREVVPEFMPYFRSTAPIAQKAIELLKSAALREKMTQELAALTEPLRGTKASERTAKLLLEMMDRRRR